MLALTLLGACASTPHVFDALLGADGARVEDKSGPPTAIYPQDGPQLLRWQYSMQPIGREVYNVDFDAQGQVVKSEQVLRENLFAERIQPQVWQTVDVLREYGAPAWTMKTWSFDGEVWVWRYDNGPNRRLLFIDLDPQGTVQSWSMGDEVMGSWLDK